MLFKNQKKANIYPEILEIFSIHTRDVQFKYDQSFVLIEIYMDMAERSHEIHTS